MGKETALKDSNMMKSFNEKRIWCTINCAHHQLHYISHPKIADVISKSLQAAYTNVLQLLSHQSSNTIEETLYQRHAPYVR